MVAINRPTPMMPKKMGSSVRLKNTSRKNSIRPTPSTTRMIFAGSTGGIITPAVVGMVAEKAGIQVGMGVVVAVTVLLLITILFSVFTKGGNEE